MTKIEILAKKINNLFFEYKAIEAQEKYWFARNCAEFYDIFETLTESERAEQRSLIDSLPYPSWSDRKHEISEEIRELKHKYNDLFFKAHGFIAF